MSSGSVRLRIEVDDPTPHHTRLAQSLKRYAAALAELANSTKNRAAFEKAAQGAKDKFVGLLGSARNIGKALGAPKLLDIDKEVSVIGTILVRAVASALESRRRKALGKVVQATHPAVREAANHLASITRFYHLAAVPKLAKSYEDAVDQTASTRVRANEALYGRSLEDATAAQRALIDYARTDPGSVYERMIDAHEALRIRLQDPKARLRELAGSIEEFVRSAKEARDAIRGIRVKL